MISDEPLHTDWTFGIHYLSTKLKSACNMQYSQAMYQPGLCTNNGTHLGAPYKCKI